MKQPHTVSRSEIARFNTKRESLIGRELSREELRCVLKDLNYYVSPLLMTYITKGVNPPIIRIARGKYAFNPKPVHITRLQQVFDKIRGMRQKKDSRVNENKIAAAIKLLKDAGYKILKPKIDYEEV